MWINSSSRCKQIQQNHACPENRTAEQILIREAALVPLLYARYSLLLKPRIKRFPTSALEWWFWQDVLIEP